eukprot:TRINITY_DN146_c1_g1_i1.p1 TRINITY_DN146_c1_g1~~TRINITY_DN146_c1_g1_i1.p1  ORF type:complete len:551 (-),score=157.67 TRINITY_DN146_c1_g1_i1:10-1662(-)
MDVLAEIRDQLTCSICNELFTVPKTLPCLHTFCSSCLEQTFENKKVNSCPLCRKRIVVEGDEGMDAFKTDFAKQSMVSSLGNNAKRFKKVEEKSKESTTEELKLQLRKALEKITKATETVKQAKEKIEKSNVQLDEYNRNSKKEIAANVKKLHEEVEKKEKELIDHLDEFYTDQQRNLLLQLEEFECSIASAKPIVGFLQNALNSSSSNGNDLKRTLKLAKTRLEELEAASLIKEIENTRIEWNGDVASKMMEDVITIRTETPKPKVNLHHISLDSAQVITDHFPFAGIALTANGLILATTQSNSVIVYNMETGEEVSRFGKSYLRTSFGIVVDSDGNIFVSDIGINRITIFNPNFELIQHFGVSGRGPGEFWQPRGMAIKNDLLYVSDYHNERIQVFNKSGTLHKILLCKYPDGSQFRPNSLFVMSDNTIAITSFSRNSVEIVNEEGECIDHFNAPERWQAVSPMGVTVVEKESGKWIFACNPDEKQVSLIDYNSRKIICDISVEKLPWSVLITPNDQLIIGCEERVYISNYTINWTSNANHEPKEKIN